MSSAGAHSRDQVPTCSTRSLDTARQQLLPSRRDAANQSLEKSGVDRDRHSPVQSSQATTPVTVPEVLRLVGGCPRWPSSLVKVLTTPEGLSGAILRARGDRGSRSRGAIQTWIDLQDQAPCPHPGGRARRQLMLNPERPRDSSDSAAQPAAAESTRDSALRPGSSPGPTCAGRS